jgi:hypothetical protein
VTIRNACKRCGDEILSNYFDDALRGLGKRGSSFADVDAITHDGDTNRFLFQEFKREGEVMSKGQKILLRGLARVNYLTVWCVRKRNDGRVDWYDVAAGGDIRTMSVQEYQGRFAAWWANEPYRLPETSTAA